MVQRSLGAPRALPVVLGLLVAASIAAPATAASPAAGGSQLATSAGPARGLVPARIAGQARSAKPRSSSPLMTYHGGVIMPTADVYPIFWGTSWPGYSGDKISGIDSFYSGWNTANYAKTTNEYSDASGIYVGDTSSSAPSVIDGSTASGGNSTSTILNEVAKEINAGAVPFDTTGNGYYPVYTDVPRGGARYCAWHSSGTVNGQRVQFAFFFKLDGDPGCDVSDTLTGHSQGLAALGNVSAHELAEAMTDPTSPGAWYDSSGYENGDKCAWTFNVPYVTFANKTNWMVQGEWSNAAYTAGTGYPNSSGQKGCLDGH